MENERYYIYKITNLVNNKIYIGKTNNLKVRWQSHKRIAKGGKDKYKGYFFHIHASIRKYGINNFKIEIIEEFNNEDECYEYETWWIDYFGSNNPKRGFNLNSGGRGSENERKETIAKRIEKSKINGANHELRERISNSMKQIFKDEPERKVIISEKNKKVWANHEFKEKQITALNKRYKDNPDIKTKIGNSHKKRYEDDPELRLKTSLKRKETFEKNPEIAKKIGETHKQRFIDNPDLKNQLSIQSTEMHKNNPQLAVDASIRLKNSMSKNPDAFKHLGSDHGMAKLDEKKVKKIREEYANKKITKIKVKDIAKKYGVSIGCVESIIYNRSWKHVK